MCMHPGTHLCVCSCMVHSCTHIQEYICMCADVWYTHVHTSWYTLMCVQMYGAFTWTHSCTNSCVCRCTVHSYARIQVDTCMCVGTFDVNCLPCLCLFLELRAYYSSYIVWPASPCLCLFHVGITGVYTVSRFPSQNTQFEGMKVSSSCLCTCTISTWLTEPSLQHLVPFFSYWKIHAQSFYLDAIYIYMDK